MCGFAGFIDRSQHPTSPSFSSIIERMTNSLQHRGPDEGGCWIEQESGVALGHRRLSIVDLTSAGAQPMHSASGRYVISYNGEIYNLEPLRQALEAAGYPLRGHSDTEILLACIETHGLHQALESVHGMFAFAIWDRENRTLSLARDRVGKKPLYYGWCSGIFMFASELKALWQHPGFDKTIDRNALGQFIQYGWISEPLSIYKNICKLQPGTCITIHADAPPWSEKKHSFWAANRVMERAVRQPFSGSFEEATDKLDTLLTQTVTERMVADVDLGALLSGGIDSSTVVGIMQKNSTQPVKTFTIGFEEKKYNEAEYATAIAKYLGTEHHELYVDPRQCLDIIDQLPGIYDEPFGDASQLPTYLLARLARQHVKVVLSGDGGDETFAGYNHYRENIARWRWMSGIPARPRKLLGKTLTAIEKQAWERLQPPASANPVNVRKWHRALGKIPRKVRGWGATSPQEMLSAHFSRTPHPENIVKDACREKSHMTDPTLWATEVTPLSAMIHYDFIGYMVGDILVKVDRATMATGLEARSPILDTRITEFAWTLPQPYLIDPRGGKRILRALLNRYIPTELTERPKRGFGVPIDEWLRGPLREWAEDLLSEQKLNEYGYFDVDSVRRLWNQHQCRWSNHASLLWSILMFQAWYGNQQHAGMRGTA